MRALFGLEFVFFFHASLILFVVWRVPRILVFMVLSVGFLYFTNVVQIPCSLSGWLHLNCSLVGIGFNGAKPMVELHAI